MAPTKIVKKIRLNTQVAAINREIARATSTLAKLEAEKLALLRTTPMGCAPCGEESPISTWTFVQRHWYVAAYGCDGGAYWNPNSTETCNMICPKCKASLYIHSQPWRMTLLTLKEQVKDVNFKNLFASHEDSYE